MIFNKCKRVTLYDKDGASVSGFLSPNLEKVERKSTLVAQDTTGAVYADERLEFTFICGKCARTSKVSFWFTHRDELAEATFSCGSCNLKYKSDLRRYVPLTATAKE